MSLPIAIHPQHGLASLGGEPHVFHCHHYNCFLQKSIAAQDGLLDVKALLGHASAEVVAPRLAAL